MTIKLEGFYATQRFGGGWAVVDLRSGIAVSPVYKGNNAVMWADQWREGNTKRPVDECQH